MPKYLIISADDFGLSKDVNQACVESITKGFVTSLSLMAPAPAFGHACQLAKENAIKYVGVHLTLTSEFENWKWGPLTGVKKSPSLCNTAGYFHQTIDEFATHATAEQVFYELSAQIDHVIRAGLIPTHLDSHMFALHPRVSKRFDLFSIFCRLAAHYRLPVRCPFEDDAQKFKALGIRTLNQCPTTTYDIETAGKFDGYNKIIQSLKDGYNELILHPACGSPELDRITRRSDRRSEDLRYALDPQLLKLLIQEGIMLKQWKNFGWEHDL